MKPNSQNNKNDYKYLWDLKQKSEMTNKEIAQAMGIGTSTVKTHLSSKSQAPYYFQFMLECLVMDKINQHQDEIDRQRKEVTENL